LVAALLDAHPEIVMSIEWGVLSHLLMGYRRNQICYSVEHHSRLFTRRLKNTWTGYNYRVDDMWQGKYRTIKLIGDKLAGQTSLILKKDLTLVDKLQQRINCPVKIIHVIRNPFDTITTMAKRSFAKSESLVDFDVAYLAQFIDRYFERVEVVQKLKSYGQLSMIDLHHEKIIHDTDSTLIELMNFLNVDITDNYMLRCSETIYKEPHKSRLEVDWPDNLKQHVQENIAKYEFLQQYSFED